MGKLAFAIFLIEAVIIMSVVSYAPPQIHAGGVIERALDASTDTTAVSIGDYTWIEDCGIGVPLPPAPLTSGAFPRLLAGKWVDATRSAALWELGADGFTTLQRKLEGDGAVFSGSQSYTFRPRSYPNDLAAKRSNISFSSGKHGVVIDWAASGRNFAVVIVDATAEQATRRSEDLLREFVLIPGVETDTIAPLMFQGRYTCVLKGWSREADRLRKRTRQGWFSLRFFQVPNSEFENVGRLQFELESKLDAAGFKRSAGLKPTIAGEEAFVGEYFGSDGFVQRIAYARLNGGYLVALMQAPESQRAALSDEMDGLTRSLQVTGIGAATGPAVLYFNRVRNVRCLAWQDGRRVLWGALFDDSRKQPVLWRQDKIRWNIQLTLNGQMVREREGDANTSRALNPLVDAELRALDLPEGIKGDVELALDVGGERTTTRITIK